ncbi:MAG: hypothetical protein CMK74_14850 [Pseudomonadales bacterium]|nr:hypothetical protein [Pseudomonadales bacterium]
MIPAAGRSAAGWVHLPIKTAVVGGRLNALQADLSCFALAPAWDVESRDLAHTALHAPSAQAPE